MYTLVSPYYMCFILPGFDWPSGFREEDFLNIMLIFIYIALWWGQTSPLGPFLRIIYIFSPFAHFLNGFLFK